MNVSPINLVSQNILFVSQLCDVYAVNFHGFQTLHLLNPYKHEIM